MLYDGVPINSLANDGDGKFGSYAVNVPAMQEVALGLGTMSAEYKDGGININDIPKEGSNSFAGLVDLGYGNGAMQWSNLNDEFRNRGVRFAAEARKTYDPMHLSHVSYTNPASTRLLIEAGFGYFHDENGGRPGDGTGALDISILELVGTETVPANYRYNASGRSPLPPSTTTDARSSISIRGERRCPT